MGILEDFRVFGAYFPVAGGIWDSVGRGARRGFRKYLTQRSYAMNVPPPHRALPHRIEALETPDPYPLLQKDYENNCLGITFSVLRHPPNLQERTLSRNLRANVTVCAVFFVSGVFWSEVGRCFAHVPVARTFAFFPA